MNIQKMMQQAAKMQEKMQSAQADLADKTVTATAGGGKVTVVASGGGDVLSIKISKEVVDPEDVEMLERDALCPEPVERGRGELGIAVATQITPAHVVGEDEKDVRLRVFCCRC